MIKPKKNLEEENIFLRQELAKLKRRKEVGREDELLKLLDQSRQKLMESQELYRDLVANARTIITRMDREGRFTFINEYGLNFFGFKEKELLGKYAYETIVPLIESTGRDLGKMLHDLLRDPDKFSVNINENIKKNGERVWVEWHNKAIFNEKHEHVGHIAIGIDITENKKNKDALIDSEARFRTIAETLPVMICVTRIRDSVILFTNELNNRAFGMAGASVVGTTGPEYYWDPNEREGMLRIFREKGFVDNHLLKVKHYDGSPFWIMTSVRPIKFQGEDALIGASIDVTAYRKVEMELEESQRRLNLALENGKIGMLDWNRRTNEVVLDERASRMHGMNAVISRITPDKFFELIHEEDIQHFLKVTRKAIDRHDSLDIIYRTRSGNFISVRSIVLTDSEHRHEGLSGVCFDVTEMKKGTEQALLKLNEELLRSNNELQQFAYVASHDLQEPLRMVASFTQLLQLQYSNKLDRTANEYIKYAVDGSKRMYALLNGLLTYSRVHSRGQKFEKVNLELVLQKVRDNLQLMINETNTIIKSERLPVVVADENQMIQLLQNLIENAIKFSKADPQISVSSVNRKGKHFIKVSDNGIGIEPQYFEKIFRIFQRLHSPGEYHGTGIGLAICKKIAERHGGDIWVKSKRGEGSTFIFTIPAGDS